MKKYSGKKVAVLWSGGFDSTFLALQLAKEGADVTCVYDTSVSLSKLGDVLNRAKVSALLEDNGVKLHEFKTEHVMSGDETRYSRYATILQEIVEYVIKAYPDSVIATGVLSSDMQCNEVVEALQSYGVVHPLKTYSYKEFQKLRETACEDYNELYGLSRCDFGQILDHHFLAPCSIAKPRESWCFKCHESGAKFIEETFMVHHLTETLQETYPDASVGWLLGHIVAGETNERPKFATRVHRFRPGNVIDGEFPVTLQIQQSGEEKWELSKQRKFGKVETVNIWLSDLKKIMGVEITEPLTNNYFAASNLINELVEQNYLPVGYEWDTNDIKVLWSAK